MKNILLILMLVYSCVGCKSHGDKNHSVVGLWRATYQTDEGSQSELYIEFTDSTMIRYHLIAGFLKPNRYLVNEKNDSLYIIDKGVSRSLGKIRVITSDSIRVIKLGQTVSLKLITPALFEDQVGVEW